MKHSDFWRLMQDEFGQSYARSVAADLVIGQLGDRTAQQALAAGLAPRSVWEAVCEAARVPHERRRGTEPSAGERAIADIPPVLR